MTDHLIDYKYTALEIDEMRGMIPKIHLFGFHITITERAMITEDHLRTYMLAGIRPAELEVLVQKYAPELKRQEEAYKKHIERLMTPLPLMDLK